MVRLDEVVSARSVALRSGARSGFAMGRYALRNRLSKASVLSGDGDGPVVSLTSYGARTASVHLTIESIAAGQLRPSRLILWLDEPRQLDNLTPGLSRLVERGLEVLPSENVGPHKKYYPFVLSKSTHDNPLVTADDDVFYPRKWLSQLDAEHRLHPDDVIGHRVRRVALDSAGRIKAYESWDKAPLGSASMLNFATGVGGTLYPEGLLDSLRDAGDKFQETCPRADDIWLHVQALRTHRKVRQLNSVFTIVPVRGTTSKGLWEHNVSQLGNDKQIAATYTADDLGLLQLAAS